jgi:hypothetical protein
MDGFGFANRLAEIEPKTKNWTEQLRIWFRWLE